MIRALLVGLFLSSFLTAAPVYQPSDESYPLIRRDLIPLDADAIAQLAADLAVTADAKTPRSAEEFRHRSKLLTLALRLDPSQPRARALEATFEEGIHRSTSTGKDRSESAKRCLNTAAWLIEMPNHESANQLGQLILDVLAPFEKDPQLIKNRDLDGEAARWLGVIPPLAAFDVAPAPPPDLPKPPTPKPPGKKEFLETRFITQSPLALVTKEGETRRGLVTLTVVLTKTNNGRLRFKPNVQDRSINPLYDAIYQFFKTQGRPLPTGYDLNVDTSGLAYSLTNKENIAAPLAMLLDSASTGRQIIPNTILFARLRADGSLDRPHDCWPLLHAIRNVRPTPGTRLLVPPSLADDLNALLVLEEPQFLLQYEIIACSTFDQARDVYFADGVLPQPLGKASASFREVADALRRTSKGNLGASLVYDSVKTRLQAAAQSSPRHLSSVALLQQAIGRRPAYFSSKMFAREFHRILTPAATPPGIRSQNPESELKTFYEIHRDSLAAFRDSRRIAREDQELVTQGIDLIDEIRSIIRLYQKFERAQATSDLINWEKKMASLRLTLAQRAGDAPSE
ncbi:MAG: hypothetical protein ACSHYF_03585 [Verrucomicrobiaceae bacterium]